MTPFHRASSGLRQFKSRVYRQHLWASHRHRRRHLLARTFTGPVPTTSVSCNRPRHSPRPDSRNAARRRASPCSPAIQLLRFDASHHDTNLGLRYLFVISGHSSSRRCGQPATSMPPYFDACRLRRHRHAQGNLMILLTPRPAMRRAMTRLGTHNDSTPHRHFVATSACPLCSSSAGF